MFPVYSADIAASVAAVSFKAETPQTIKEKKMPQWDVDLQATKEQQSVRNGAKTKDISMLQ